ncbi:MAG: hypothetical protein IH932_00295 [Thaumarchaeota archaeon]|nr:hypothetical protein [Nitrososphaerota archaeon]
MPLEDDEIKRAADVKSWLETKISGLEEEIAELREVVLVMDSVLLNTSFRTAAELPRAVKKVVVQGNVDIRRAKDGKTLGTAEVDSEKVVISIAGDLKLLSSTPPFRSFFINRILEGMKEKDRSQVSQGKLDAKEVIDYLVEEKDSELKKITIKNYRDQKRLGEIFSTINWAFSRMLEKSK